MLVCFVGATLAGCAGGGTAGPPPVPIVGHFLGTWDQPFTGDHGTLDWTVSSTGDLTGTVIDTQDGSGVMDESTVLRAGSCSAQLLFPEKQIIKKWSGRLTLSGNALTGTLAQDGGDITIPTNVTLQAE